MSALKVRLLNVLIALALAFAALAVAAYEAAWRIRPANPIWIAELIVGALWGVLIVCLA